jgi:hypothetical protein
VLKEVENALGSEFTKLLQMEKKFLLKNFNLSKEFDLSIEGTIEMK